MYFIKLIYKDQSIGWDMNESIQELQEAIDCHQSYGSNAKVQLFTLIDLEYLTLDDLKDMPIHMIAKLLKELA